MSIYVNFFYLYFNFFSQSVVQPIESLISSLELCRTASPFERRCTAIEWHPTNPNILAVGSKGGEILLWDMAKNKETFLHGVSNHSVNLFSRLNVILPSDSLFQWFLLYFVIRFCAGEIVVKPSEIMKKFPIVIYKLFRCTDWPWWIYSSYEICTERPSLHSHSLYRWNSH